MDIAFCLPVKDGSPKSHSQYVKHLKARLEESYQIAKRISQKVAGRNKRRFDKAVRESTLEEGDQVLVKNMRFQSKHKLQVGVHYVQGSGKSGRPTCMQSTVRQW